MEKEIDFLLQKGAEKIILDPVYELYFLQHSSLKAQILPLFSTYLHQFVFPYSLVGKIGILTDFATKDEVQQLISGETQKVPLTEKQQATKKFHFPFGYRVKSESSWMYAIQNL